MKKKLASLAVLTATLLVSATALSQEVVRIYGRLNLGVDRWSATGATAGTAADYKGRMRLYDAGSRLGFEGSEDLGGGLKAIFLIETGVNVDAGGINGQGGAVNFFTGFWNSRIGHVGLQGNWGRLTFGRSNVWWGNGIMEQASVNYLASGNPSFYGLLGRGMNVFIQRQSNTVQYTAQIEGYALQVSYSPNGEAQPAGANTDGRLLAVTAQGQWGPFAAGVDWAKNQGNKPATGGTPTSTGQKVRAGWQYAPGSMLAVIGVKSIQENGGAAAILAGSAAVAGALGLLPPDSTAATKLQQASWGVNWEHTFGNMIGIVQYAKVNDITGCVTPGACDNTGATSYMVGARLNLSKRTGVYASYATIRNEANYNMDYIGASMSSANVGGLLNTLPASSVGADPKMFGVGLMHNF